MAMLYNDRAVLENHHASASLRLMKDEDYNIVSSLKPAEYRHATVTQCLNCVEVGGGVEPP